MSSQNSTRELCFSWWGRFIPRILNEVWKASAEKRIEHSWTGQTKIDLVFGGWSMNFHEIFPFGYTDLGTTHVFCCVTDLGMTEKDMLRKEVGPHWQWRVENLWGVSWPQILDMFGVLAAWRSDDIRNIQKKLARESDIWIHLTHIWPIFDPSVGINPVGVA